MQETCARSGTLNSMRAALIATKASKKLTHSAGEITLNGDVLNQGNSFAEHKNVRNTRDQGQVLQHIVGGDASYGFLDFSRHGTWGLGVDHHDTARWLVEDGSNAGHLLELNRLAQAKQAIA